MCGSHVLVAASALAVAKSMKNNYNVIYLFSQLDTVNMITSQWKHGKMTLSETTKIATISFVAKEYQLSFDMKPASYDYTWASIIRTDSEFYETKGVWLTTGLHQDKFHMCLPNYGHKIFCYHTKHRYDHCTPGMKLLERGRIMTYYSQVHFSYYYQQSSDVTPTTNNQN